jgi:hypothetical protein
MQKRQSGACVGEEEGQIQHSPPQGAPQQWRPLPGAQQPKNSPSGAQQTFAKGRSRQPPNISRKPADLPEHSQVHFLALP